MASRFVLLWGIIYVGISIAAGHVFAWTVVPFSVSNQSPLVQIYGLPSAEEALVTPQGRLNTRVSIDIANHFLTECGVNERIYLDGESYRTTLALRFGLSDRAEIGMDVPYVMYRGGFLDGTIETFHETFNYSSLLRDQTENNQLLFVYQRAGVDEILLDDSTEGLGDIKLMAGWQIIGDNAHSARVSLRGILKLPTGDENRLRGSGGTDFALSLSASKSWPVLGETGLYGGGGVLLMSKGDVLPELQREAVGFGTLGVGWRPVQILAIKLQLDGHSPFYRNSSLDELNDPGLQGTIGFTFSFGTETAFDLAVVENLIKETSPDVVVHFALRHRF